MLVLPAENSEDEVEHEEGSDDDEGDEVDPVPRVANRIVHLLIVYLMKRSTNKGSFTLRDETMWCRTHDSLTTFNTGLGTLKT